MKIDELKSKAREDAKGNILKLTWPIFLSMFIIFLLRNYLEILGNSKTDNIIMAIPIVLILVFACIVLPYGIIIRTMKIARKESSQFFKDTFIEEIKNGFSCAWEIFKKVFGWFLLYGVSYVLIALGFGGGLFAANAIALIMLPIGFFLLIFSNVKLIITLFKCILIPYLKHDEPDSDTGELFDESEDLMDGNKAKALAISFTFAGWFILAFLCSVGVVFGFNQIFSLLNIAMPFVVKLSVDAIVYFIFSYVIAYMNMTYYEFYMDLAKPFEVNTLENQNAANNSINYKWSIWAVVGLVIAFFAIILIAIVVNGMRTPNIINELKRNENISNVNNERALNNYYNNEEFNIKIKVPENMIQYDGDMIKSFVAGSEDMKILFAGTFDNTSDEIIIYSMINKDNIDLDSFTKAYIITYDKKGEYYVASTNDVLLGEETYNVIYVSPMPNSTKDYLNIYLSVKGDYLLAIVFQADSRDKIDEMVGFFE